ncbi:MAG: hypothetical protein SLRJCFUN_001059 [Candidatus Fervidibacter sp.]|jgi:hypothetical protein
MRCTVLLLLLSVPLVGCIGGGGGGISPLSGAQAVIRGFVRDANGNPVAGAQVSTFVNNQIVRTTSGADGSFVLSFSLTSQTVLTVTAQKDNQSASAPPVLVKPGAETTVTITLNLTPSVGGGVGADTPPPPPF